ncbi:MAG: 5-carboxymethyl-2-hydroxymuconate Delta-isomerase [Flavobacteriales bacterium]
MPHFILDLSPPVVTLVRPDALMHAVHDTADASGLFAKGDIKVRIRKYKQYLVGGAQQDFIHVFGYIMEGRMAEQKKALSVAIVTRLKELLPSVPVISMNVMEFEKATYTNRTMVQPG